MEHHPGFSARVRIKIGGEAGERGHVFRPAVLVKTVKRSTGVDHRLPARDSASQSARLRSRTSKGRGPSGVAMAPRADTPRRGTVDGNSGGRRLSRPSFTGPLAGRDRVMTSK